MNKKYFLMDIPTETGLKMKKHLAIALTGTLMLAAVFVFQAEMFRSSSPFMLLIFVITGILLSFKFKLPGGIFLFFGGMSLAVYPLLFPSSYWLLPGGILTGYSGLTILINWWHQGEH